VDVSNSLNSQLFLITYPAGQALRITNDVSDYSSVSVGVDAVGAVRTQVFANLWVADAEAGRARQLTQERSAENSPFSPMPLDDRTVVFEAVRGTEHGLWSLPLEGGGMRRLPTGPGYAFNHMGHGGTILFSRYETGKVSLWRVSADGTDLRRLTEQGGDVLLDLSPDGRFATYSDTSGTVWIVSTDTGEKRTLATNTTSGLGLFSPTGDRVLFAEYSTQGGLLSMLYRVVPATGGDPSPPVPLPATAMGVAWGPGGTSLAYRDHVDAARNVHLLPLDGGPLRRITQFTDGRVKMCKYSPDGSRLALVRQEEGNENLWILNADGSNATPVTEFHGITIYEGDWTPDGRRVVFRAGTDSRDAVLIRNFR
jgi:Tol biopolymer transport system component